MKKIVFLADAHQVKGPRKTDNAYSVVFETGEYQKDNVAEIMKIPNEVVKKVTVEYEETTA